MRNREFVFTPKIEYKLVAGRGEANQNRLKFPTWCRGWDSNPHDRIDGHRILSPARIPVSPPRQYLPPAIINFPLSLCPGIAYIPILLEFATFQIYSGCKIDLDGFIPATILIVKGILLPKNYLTISHPKNI